MARPAGEDGLLLFRNSSRSQSRAVQSHPKCCPPSVFLTSFKALELEEHPHQVVDDALSYPRQRCPRPILELLKDRRGSELVVAVNRCPAANVRMTHTVDKSEDITIVALQTTSPARPFLEVTVPRSSRS